MRKAAVIAYVSLMQTFRDRKALALMLLMPILLIAILGNALKGMMTGSSIQPFEVLVVLHDQPVSPPLPPGQQSPPLHFGQILVDQVLQDGQVQRIIRYQMADELAHARSEVAAGSAVAAIYVPERFTADSLSGTATSIEVITDPGRPDLANIVVQIVRSFTDVITSTSLASRNLGPEQAQAAMADVSQNLPRVVEAPSGVRDVSAMQYYAAAMAVMFMLMTALARASSIIRERRDGTLARMLVSPTSRATVLAGQIMGSLATVFAQFVVLAAGTHLLFGVYWGPWPAVLVIGFAFSLAGSGLGMAAASLLNDPKAADASIGVVGNLCAALSGAMAPLWVFPDAMKMVARAIPNYWALQGFLDQMAGAGQQTLWLPVAVLTAIGIFTGALGSLRLAAR